MAKETLDQKVLDSQYLTEKWRRSRDTEANRNLSEIAHLFLPSFWQIVEAMCSTGLAARPDDWRFRFRLHFA